MNGALVEQITKVEYDRTVPEWHQKAMNDPAVHPFLGSASWRSLDDAPVNDWERAVFMDKGRLGLLSVRMDREASNANLCLWVLGRNPVIAALLMRFAIRVVPVRYGMKFISFGIQDNNAQWLERATRTAGKWKWGIEPDAAHDVNGGGRVSLHYFKVPASELRRQGATE